MKKHQIILIIVGLALTMISYGVVIGIVLQELSFR